PLAPPAPSPLSLHDALPISCRPPLGRHTVRLRRHRWRRRRRCCCSHRRRSRPTRPSSSTSSTTSWPPTTVSSCFWPSIGVSRLRSEEHTSELQSLTNLVCRL